MCFVSRALPNQDGGGRGTPLNSHGTQKPRAATHRCDFCTRVMAVAAVAARSFSKNISNTSAVFDQLHT